MPDSTRPFLVVYVVWHPAFAAGAEIAERVREHFRRQLYANVAGGAGLSVIYRSTPPPGETTPLPIVLDEADTTAVVVLADVALAADAAWVNYVQQVGAATEAVGLGSRLFPVSIEAGALVSLKVDEQALRWDLWAGNDEGRCTRLLMELTYEFCRMLRHYLEHLKHPYEEEAALEQYLTKVRIFLSHSKHDRHGTAIALAIRNNLHASHGLASFFDVHDIPGGLKFHKVILQQVRTSAVVAIHTDSYSSREWCRKEIIEAKRASVPLVVANSISDVDERGFPYMGNVPLIRLEPHHAERIDFVISRLMDEVLKDFLWQCQVHIAGAQDPNVIFLPRPPELISLASLPPIAQVPQPLVVYPDPPLSTEEERLFATIAPHVQLRSRSEWLAGVVR